MNNIHLNGTFTTNTGEEIVNPVIFPSFDISRKFDKEIVVAHLHCYRSEDSRNDNLDSVFLKDSDGNTVKSVAFETPQSGELFPGYTFDLLVMDFGMYLSIALADKLSADHNWVGSIW